MKTEKYAFACEKACRSYKAEGRELWTLTVRAGDLPRGFKYGPNARYATLSSRPAKEMLRTLETDPASFILKNNGIMVVADSIRVDGNDVSLECREAENDEDAPGHGVLNGGHTYRVLTHVLEGTDPRYGAASDVARVMITVGIGIPEEEIWLISRARNTSEKVPLHALRELAGDWSELKKHLPLASRALVAFKPNDPEAPDAEYDVADLLKRLVLLSNELFPAQENKHPVQAYTSIGSLVRQYKPENFAGIAHLLPDALRLEELVVRHWDDNRGNGPDRYGIARASGVSEEDFTLLSGMTAHLSLPAPFVLPVIAAFRVFIVDGQWFEPLDKLWEQYGRRTVRALWEAYKEQGRGPAVFGRSRQSWAAACDLTKSAAIQKGLIKVT
jgi:hypothetical protein